MPVECLHFADFGQALTKIRQEHRPDSWYYRGQVQRRDPHDMVVDDSEMHLENLYPGSLRFVIRHSTRSVDFDDDWRKATSRAESLFHAFNAFLLARYKTARGTAEEEKFVWLNPYVGELMRVYNAPGPSVFSGFHEKGWGLKNPELIRLTWSLAQHYEVVTALLDLTFDPEVAAWFATNEWRAAPDPRVLEGIGVIYRFPKDSLEAGITMENLLRQGRAAGNVYESPYDRCFVQDLRNIPAAFALRPLRQQAAVLSGFDTLRLLWMLCGAGRITAFLFPHVPDEQQRWPLKLTREDLIPSTDPFADLKAEFDEQWAPNAEKLFSARYTKPVAVVTDRGTKMANPGALGTEKLRQIQRETLYDAATRMLGAGEIDEAAARFESVIATVSQPFPDKISSYAYLGLAEVRQTRGDFSGMADALGKALDGPDGSSAADWAGQVLASVAMAVESLLEQGHNSTGMELLHRILDLARRCEQTEQVQFAAGQALIELGIRELEPNPEIGLRRLTEAIERFAGSSSENLQAIAAVALLAIGTSYRSQSESAKANGFFQQIIDCFEHAQSDRLRAIVRAARAELLTDN